MAASVLLPDTVRPKKYTLTIEPNFETFEFSGKVVISLEILKPCSELIFHADALEIHSAELRRDGNVIQSSTSSPLSVKVDKESHKAVVGFGDVVLSPGIAELALEYKGTLNDNMMGFYRSSYQADGKKHWMATTQFEPTGARLALPCWDEPALKATFDVTLVVPQDLTALSNMPVVETTLRKDGANIVHFAETPIMSTYLLAFVIGRLAKVSGKTSDGIEVNVYATPGNEERGRFALDAASKLIPFFSEYFGIAYPLPKADLIAIPDFAAGAMENWGLITFRDVALLVDEALSSATACQRVAYVVSHELAHQWFGNLVTMQWWNDLWLNEGFATWVGWLGVDHIKPGYGVWTQFVSSDLGHALETDALLSSHPVEVPINDPKEIEQVFDALSYMKGASILRQLDAAVGPALFRKGLHSYLSRFQYKNTVTSDLWKAVGEASGKPVESMMRGWTKQMGYPLITVQGGGGKAGLTLRQTRFLANGPPSAKEDSSLWMVPVTAVGGDKEGKVEALPTFLLEGKEGEAEELVVAEGGWLKLNAGQVGFFRVNYTPQLWGALEAGVLSLALGVSDRLGILMDAFALAKAGIMPTTRTLDLALSYRNEPEYTVWSQLAGGWGEIELLLSTTDHLPQFETLGQHLFSPIGQKMGWTKVAGESHQSAMLRPLVLRRLAMMNHTPSVDKCKQLFADLKQDPTSVAADLRRMVASIAVKVGGREEYEAVKKLYKEADMPDFKQDCLLAMGMTQKEELIKEYLAFGYNENEVKAQDTLYVCAIMAANPAARETSWRYTRENWGTIYARFHNTSSLLTRLVTLPVGGFCTLEKAQEVEDFYDANPVPEAQMELNRTLEKMRTLGQWLQRDEGAMIQWLQSKKVVE